jgi:dihydrofolate synthase/folylpolyglutamate synthase
MIESVLRAAGYRTGLYTSPHLVHFRERIQVQGQPLSDSKLLEALNCAERAASAMGKEGELTFFETATVAAFWAFARHRVEVAVIETGMGGRFDATNVLSSDVAVITSIDMDHAEYLGPTRTDIAREKAGILRPGRPAVLGDLPRDALGEVLRIAQEVGAAPVYASREVVVQKIGLTMFAQRLHVWTRRWGDLEVELPLLGPHQRTNMALAMAALDRWAEMAGQAIPTAALAVGLSQVRWPARFQLLEVEPPTWLDGAHNPHGAQALAATLAELQAPPVDLLWSMLRDKDRSGFLAALSPHVAEVWVVPVHSERAASVEDLARTAKEAGLVVHVAGSLFDAWRASGSGARARDRWRVVTGSLYLAGEVLSSPELFQQNGPTFTSGRDGVP